MFKSSRKIKERKNLGNSDDEIYRANAISLRLSSNSKFPRRKKISKNIVGFLKQAIFSLCLSSEMFDL